MPLSVTLPGNVEFATFWVLSVRSTGPIPRRCSSGCIVKGAWAPSCLPVGQVAFHVAVTHGHPHPQAAAFTWRETHVWGSGHLSQLLILFFNPTCKNKVTETSPSKRMLEMSQTQTNPYFSSHPSPFPATVLGIFIGVLCEFQIWLHTAPFLSP